MKVTRPDPPVRLRLLPRDRAAEHLPHIVARGGWVMTGAAADICVAALGRPQIVALCGEGCPPASDDDIVKIRRGLADAMRGPDDLGAHEAREWFTRLCNAQAGGEVVHLDMPSPVRPADDRRAPSEMQLQAASLAWKAGG